MADLMALLGGSQGEASPPLAPPPDGSFTDPRTGAVHLDPSLRGPLRAGAARYEAGNVAQRADVLAVHHDVWSGTIDDPSRFAREMEAIELRSARGEGGPEGDLEVEGGSLREWYEEQFDRVCEGEVVPVPDANLLNRAVGLLQVLGGAGEMALGGALLLAPEPTMLTKVGGVALGLHGSDTLTTGLRTLWTGEVQDTVTADLVQSGAEGLGVDPQTADTIGDSADALLGILGTLGAGAALAAGRSTVLGGAASLTDDLVKPGAQLATKTGTVMDQITAMGPLRGPTKVPKFFELTAGRYKFWVHPNATKHMEEYLTRSVSHGNPINSQTLLTSFQGAVEDLVSKPLVYEEVVRSGPWELIFSAPRDGGLLPVIKHAVYMP